MGGGSFDAHAYRSFATNAASKPVDHIYTSRGVDPSLNPKGVKIRESRDSADNPESTPIIVALDVTGSMGIIAEQIAKGGLGTLFEGILQRKPVTHPHLMFMGVGDIDCDKGPLQVSQFEADNRIVDQLTKIWIERGGGGNDHESYDFPWYFAARHTEHDALIKRGKRGYLFTIGDEKTPVRLSAHGIERFLGYSPQADVPSEVSLSEARRKYDVFHVIIEKGDYASRRLDAVQQAWRRLLGQHVISLPDHNVLPETIVSAIQVAEGADARTAASGWGHHASSVVGNAVASLPRGAVKPRQLGR